MPYVDPQHRPANANATSANTATTSRRSGENGYAKQSAALKPAARSSDPPKKEGWGAWFDRKREEAGSWVSESTSGAVDWAKETASEVRDYTQEKAADVRSAWDTATNTDYSVDRNGMGVAMRVRDLQKMLPPEAAAQLNFDEKHLDDRISARYEYGTDYVTLTAPTLSLSGLNIQGFQCGAANATDVSVVISNPGGKLPFVQEGWQDSGNLLMNVTVGSAKAEAIKYGQGPSALSATSLEVHGLNMTGAAPTSRVIGTGGGVASGGFSVERAVVKGAEIAGMNAGEVEVQGGQANWREDTGQVNAGADAISVNDVSGNGVSVDAARVDNVQANTNGQLAAVTAGGASMSGFKRGDDHIGSASLSGVNANIDRSTSTVDVTADTHSVEDLQFGSTSLQSLQADGLSASAAPSGLDHSRLNVDARNVTAKGLKVDDDVSIDDMAASNLAFGNDTGAKTQSASANTLRTSGVSGDGFAAENLVSNDARYNLDRNSGDLAVSASAMTGTNVTGGPVNAAGLNVKGLDYSNNVRTHAGATRLDSVTLQQLTSEHGSASAANAEDLVVRHADDGFGVTATGLSADNVASQYGSTYRVAASGLDVQTTGKSSHANLDSLHANNVASQYGNASSLRLAGLTGNSSVQDGVRKSQADLASLGVTGLDAKGVHAGQLDAQKLSASAQGSEYSASMGDLQGSELSYGDLASIRSARLQGLGVDHGAGGTNASLQSGAFAGTQVQQDGMSLAIADAQLRGGSAQLGGDRAFGLDYGKASGISGGWDGTGGPPIQIPGVDFDRHQLDASIGLKPGTFNLGGSREMVQSAGQLVDNADVRMSMPLLAADYGLVEVEKNTHLDGRAQVRNGALVPGQTGVSMSKGLDAPLWTTVKGVHLDSDRKGRGKVRADVGGFFDQNISSQVMGALGQDSNRVPLSVAELSRLGGNQMDSGPSKGQVTLDREQATDNQLQLRSTAQGAVASFVRLLVSSVNVQSGKTNVSAGRTAVGGATIQSKGTPNNPDQVSGAIKSLEVEQLRTVTSE